MSLRAAIEEAGLVAPPRLAALALWSAELGHQNMRPSERGAHHPLLIPFARGPGGVIGLLRWATPPDSHPIPVVREDANGLHLVAPSVDQLLHTELATRDAEGAPLDDLLEASNADSTLYERGMVELVGHGLNAYLILSVGAAPSFYEQLALRHLDREDGAAALVTADRGCTAALGWGRPLAFRARLLADLGRMDEARDAARLSLLEPTWTLGGPVTEVALLAGWRPPITSRSWRLLADNDDKSVLDRAAHLMDAVHVEGGDWAAVRPQLADWYDEGGLATLAAFVRIAP